VLRDPAVLPAYRDALVASRGAFAKRRTIAQRLRARVADARVPE